MTVSLVFDPFGASCEPSTVRVQDEADYVPACEIIEKALANDANVRVAVTNRAMRRWFDHFHGPKVMFKEIDPCAVLAERLGADVNAIPLVVRQDPGVIVQLGLLEEAIEKQIAPDEPVESWILRVSLAPVWGRPAIGDPSTLGELLRETEKHVQASLHPTLMAMRKARQHAWIASSGDFAPVVRWLMSGSPSHRAGTALTYRLLADYPDAVRRRALQYANRFQELMQLDGDPTSLRAIPLASLRRWVPDPAVRQTVREYLASRLAEEGLGPVLPILTGQLEDECTVLRSYLQQRLEEIDEPWKVPLLSVLALFSDGGSDYSDFVRWVGDLVPRPVPSKLEADAGWTRVSQWFKSEYQPYYRWCVRIGQVERTTASVEDFEQWVLQSHTDLTWTRAFAPFAVQDTVAALHHRGLATALVVIDGLSWESAEQLRNALVSRQCLGLDLEAGITTIPSATRVAKPSLVRGQLPGQLLEGPEKNQGYDKLLATALGVSSDEVLSAWSDDVDFDSMVTDRRRVYLYLANDIDDLIHHKGSPAKRHQKMLELVEGLAEDIVSARQTFVDMYGEELAVVVASDHGFSELPSDCSVIPYKERPGEHVSHCRFVQLAATVSDAHDGLVAVGPDMLGGIDVSFLVARGYSCLKARPKAATHGGLTPQEMVVPVLTIGARPDFEPMEIQVALEGAIRRGKRDNAVRICFVNSNPVRVLLTDLAVRLVTLDTPASLEVDANSSLEIDGWLDASSVREKELDLAIRFSADYLGDVREIEVSQVLETTGAALTNDPFEDSFDL